MSEPPDDFAWHDLDVALPEVKPDMTWRTVPDTAMNEVEAARELLRRPPAWGPNDKGDVMVDMTVEEYEQALDALVAVVRTAFDWSER